MKVVACVTCQNKHKHAQKIMSNYSLFETYNETILKIYHNNFLMITLRKTPESYYSEMSSTKSIKFIFLGTDNQRENLMIHHIKQVTPRVLVIFFLIDKDN